MIVIVAQHMENLVIVFSSHNKSKYIAYLDTQVDIEELEKCYIIYKDVEEL